MNYQERLKKAMSANVTAGDFMVSDNIYVEYKKGVSVADLSIKYDMPIDKVIDMLRALGEDIEE